MVNVSGLGESDDGVDEDVGLSVSGSSDGELSVGSVHRVSGLRRQSKEVSAGHVLRTQTFWEDSPGKRQPFAMRPC